MVAAVDEFILYDDMQYTRRDWRNRNKIKTPQDLQWLTVPVKVRGKYLQTILETEIDGSAWMDTHWKALVQNYRRAPFFAEVAEVFEPLYRMNNYTHLSQLNRTLIEAVCRWLGISTKISMSSDYSLVEGKSERLADLCRQANATEYVSGPAAKDYMEAEPFSKRGIEVSWFDYDGYPEYPQLWGDFAHGVTVLDLLFNCGRSAPRYMKFTGTR